MHHHSCRKFVRHFSFKSYVAAKAEVCGKILSRAELQEKNIRGFVNRLQASKLKLHQSHQSPHPNFRLSAIIASQVGLEMFGSAEN